MNSKVKMARDIISAVKGHKYEYLFKLAIIYGVSRYELLNLKWSDIDFNKNLISFSPVKYIKDNNYNYQWLKESKLEYKRTYPLVENLKEILEDKYLESKESEYVCVNSSGKRITANTIGRNLKQILSRNSLPIVLYGELRDILDDFILTKTVDSNHFQAWKRFDILVRNQNIYEKLNLNLNKKLVRELNKFLTNDKYIFKEEIEM